MAWYFWLLVSVSYASGIEVAVDAGNALVQLNTLRSKPKAPRLRYDPVKYLAKCPTIAPDFGPHPNEGALKGLGQHLQVAMEVSCTNFFMRCAYATQDFGLLADAISSG